MMDRIVILVDMDCFYCQVESRLNPSLKGKPLAVVQYNQWKGGGIIAVNYEARDFGVTRSMRGDEAKKKCPDIKLVHVPSMRGKADLTKYRDAGREVVDVLCQFSDCVQRASVDEAYIDVTHAVNVRMKDIPQIQPSQLASTFVVGFCDSSNDEDERLQGLTSWLDGIYGLQDEVQIKLAVAALIVEEMRTAVFKQTGFQCSAGIAHNKILGKLACGLHKPNRQTILPQSGVPGLFKTLPVRKVRNLGGKFGCMVEEQLQCTVMADLLRFSEQQLQQRFDEKTGTWLYNIARGIDNEPVTPRLLSKSIGCCKKFPGRQALGTRADVEYWLGELAAEVAERLEKDLDENKRRAKLLCVSFVQDSSCSRSGPLLSYDPQRIANDAFDLLKKSNSGNQDAWFPPLKFLGISVGKFVDESCNQNTTLLNFFKTTQKIADTGYNSKVKQEEVDKTVCNRDESNARYEKKFDGSAYYIQDHIEDTKGKQENKAEDTNKGGDETSSLKNSFFVRYMKRKAAKNAIMSSSADNSDDDMFENNEKSNYVNKINSSDFGCGQKTLSNLIIRKDKVSATETDSKCENVNGINFGASTSRADDADELCVSLSEIFPDLDGVDDSVVDLLPSPMQRKLRQRIANRENLNEKLETQKNEIGTKVENDFNLEQLDSEHVINHSNRASVKSGNHATDSRNRDIIMENLDTRINCEKRSNSKDEFQDQQKQNLNTQIEQKFHSSQNSKAGIKIQNVMEEPDAMNICEKENSPVSEPQHQKEEIFSQNDHRTLKSVNEESSLRKQGIITGDSNSVTVSRNGDCVSKSNNSPEDNVDSGLVEKCPECGRLIHLIEYLEHLDFHAAENLHKELNRAPQPAAPRKISNVEITTKRKRGRPGKKTTVIGADKKLRSITAFFTPKR